MPGKVYVNRGVVWTLESIEMFELPTDITCHGRSTTFQTPTWILRPQASFPDLFHKSHLLVGVDLPSQRPLPFLLASMPVGITSFPLASTATNCLAIIFHTSSNAL